MCSLNRKFDYDYTGQLDLNNNITFANARYYLLYTNIEIHFSEFYFKYIHIRVTISIA